MITDQNMCPDPGMSVLSALKAVGACVLISIITYKMGEYSESKRHDKTRRQLTRTQASASVLQIQMNKQISDNEKLQRKINNAKRELTAAKQKAEQDLATSRQETERVRNERSAKERFYEDRYGAEYERTSHMVDCMSALARLSGNG